jgi:hypothetical protein
MPRVLNKVGILKATREKHQVIYSGKLIRITSDLSAETQDGRKAYNDIFQVSRLNF